MEGKETMKKLLEPLLKQENNGMLSWVLLFLIIEFGFTWLMEAMILHHVTVVPDGLNWTQMALSALLLFTGLLAGRSLLVFSMKKSAGKEGWWVLAGLLLVLSALAGSMGSVFSQTSWSMLEGIYYVLEEVFPWIFLGCTLSLFLLYGGLLSSLLFALGSLLWMNTTLPAVLESPLLVLLRALLPLVFLMVLNIDLSEEEPEKEETAGKPASRKKKALAWTANGLLLGLVSLILLFGMGLLPWIPTAIATGSMQPALQVGDLAVVDTTRTIPVEGDVISYESQGVSVVHRVIEVRQEEGETLWITKGDNNTEADPAPVHASQIEGVVCWSLPWAGWLTLWMHAG